MEDTTAMLKILELHEHKTRQLKGATKASSATG